MKVLFIYLCSLFIFTSFSVQVNAMELDAQVEAVKWRYQEYAKDVTGFSTLLPSKADGTAALLKLRVSSERDGDWFFSIDGSYMDSTAWANEAWNTQQTNDLSVKQQDVRLDMQYRMLDARFGIWLSQRKQTQSRKNFVVNGRATAVAGEPIDEVITTEWVGLSFTGRGGIDKQLEIILDAAVPLQVEVTNPLFASSFTKTRGYRTGVHIRWTLPKQEVGVSGLNLILGYEYQELGGESQASGGFWPYNRWQMASAGLLYAW